MKRTRKRFARKLAQSLPAGILTLAIASAGAVDLAQAHTKTHRGSHGDRLTSERHLELMKLLKPPVYPTGPIPKLGPDHTPKQKAGATMLDQLKAALAAVGEAIIPSAEAAPVGSKVDLKILVISADGKETSLPAITSFLDRMGVPYDVLTASNYPNIAVVGSKACDLVAKLYVGASVDGCAPTNYAAYQGVILATSTLPTSFGTNAFSQDAWTVLAAYEKTFGVREVDMYSLPGGFRPTCTTVGATTNCANDTLGLTMVGTAGSSATISASLTNPAGQSVFPYINAATPITIKNAYYYFASTNASATPLLVSGTNTLASIYQSPDGRQILTMTMDHNPSLLHTVSLARGLVSWVTKGLFAGEFRLSILAQPDDMFIEDDVWDPACPSPQSLGLTTTQAAAAGLAYSRNGCTPADLVNGLASGTLSAALVPFATAVSNWYAAQGIDTAGFVYRMSATALNNVVTWQNGLRTSTTTPDFKIEWPFNGVGTDPDYGYSTALLTAAQNQRAQFNWVTHTYDHSLLEPTAPYPNKMASGGFTPAVTVNGDANFVGIRYEFTQNDTIASSRLGLTTSGGSQNYFLDTVVTPNISGLAYYDTIATLGSRAKFMVSDTSIADHDSVLPNTGWYNYTASASNSLLMIPRHPTNLYYNVSTPAEWVSEYNYMYGMNGSVAPNFWGLGRDLTYPEILDRESDVLLLYLLKGDTDPWMFHQTNLRNFAWSGGNFPAIGLTNSTGHSLLADLINATLTKYKSNYNLPIQSPSLHSLGLDFQRRTDRVLNKAGLTLTYSQDSATSQSLILNYAAPTAATAPSVTSAAANCDPGWRPLPGPGDDRYPSPCSNASGTLNTWTKLTNPNPASSIVVPMTIPATMYSNANAITVGSGAAAQQITLFTVKSGGATPVVTKLNAGL